MANLIERELKKQTATDLDDFYRSIQPVQNLNLPKSPLGLWLKLNGLGFFTSTWETDDKSVNRRNVWQPHADQWKWFKWVLAQRGMFLFMGARKMGKTELLVIFQCVWLLTQDPQHLIMIITGTDKRGKELLKNIRTMLSALGVPLHGDAETTIRLIGNKSKQENVQYAGVNGKIKGNHCDLIVVDDPLDESEGFSDTKRTKVSNVVSEAISMSDRLLIIGQYVNENDLMSQWQDNVPTFRAWISNYPHLCKMTRERFLQNGTLRSWGMNYEGVFYTSNEAIFSGIQLSDVEPTGHISAVLDVAMGGADRTALAIGGTYWDTELQDEVMVALLVSWQASWAEVIDEIVAYLKESEIDWFFYEGMKGKVTDNLLGRLLVEEHGFDWRQIGMIDSTQNKVFKINRLKGYVGTGRIRVHENTPQETLNLLKTWTPLSRHDDVPDALAMLSEKVFKY